METPVEFSVLMKKFLIDHAEGLIYPVRTQADERLNSEWMQRHSEGYLFREHEHARRLFYKENIFERAYLKGVRIWGESRYLQFLDIRERVINHCALGLLRPALFDNSQYSPVGRKLHSEYISPGNVANIIFTSEEDLRIWSERDSILLCNIKLKKRKMGRTD